MSKWANNARGLKVDTQSVAWNYLPAWQKDISFLVYELNPEYGMFYNSWVNGLTQPYNYKVPVIGIYNVSVAAADQLMEYGYWADLDKNVPLLEDRLWLHIKSLLLQKWVNALCLNFVDFYENNDPDKPLPEAHVIAIVREVTKRVRKHAKSVYPNRVNKVFIQIDERVVRNLYPDLGTVLVHEAHCLTELETLSVVKVINDWAEFEDHLPPDKVPGYADTELHDNPPISFCQAWNFWKFADFNSGKRNGFLSADFKRANGKAVMGGVIFNGDRNKLAEYLGMIVPDYTKVPPDSEPDPEPPVHEDPVGSANSAVVINALKAIIAALKAIVSHLSK